MGIHGALFACLCELGRLRQTEHGESVSMDDGLDLFGRNDGHGRAGCERIDVSQAIYARLRRCHRIIRAKE